MVRFYWKNRPTAENKVEKPLPRRMNPPHLPNHALPRPPTWASWEGTRRQSRLLQRHIKSGVPSSSLPLGEMMPCFSFPMPAHTHQGHNILARVRTRFTIWDGERRRKRMEGGKGTCCVDCGAPPFAATHVCTVIHTPCIAMDVLASLEKHQTIHHCQQTLSPSLLPHSRL